MMDACHNPPPSDLKRFFNQRIMPVAIDGVACLDMRINRTVELVQRNPAMALGLAAGIGILLAAWLRPRGPRKA
jgi:hypothetical protein